MKSGTALRAVGAGWLRTKVVESGLPAGRDREVLNSGLLLAFSEIEVRDRAQLVPVIRTNDATSSARRAISRREIGGSKRLKRRLKNREVHCPPV